MEERANSDYLNLRKQIQKPSLFGFGVFYKITVKADGPSY